MTDHNANQDYPEFNAQSVADGYWEVYHDDSCGETFDWFGGAPCQKCGFRPDMQSIAARKTSNKQSVPAPLSQSAEGMTAQDDAPLFSQLMVDCLKNMAMSDRKLGDFFAERLRAFAEHRTAALTAELDRLKQELARLGGAL